MSACNEFGNTNMAPEHSLAEPAPVESPDGLPVIPFESPSKFAQWLERHHTSSPGIWLRIFKKASARKTVTYAEALDAALCYGWIDGKRRAGDAESFVQRFTPRGPRSQWSKVNQGHIERLTREGRMRPAGLAAVEAAKADGRWAAAYDSSRSFELPAEFTEALNRLPAAAEFFATLTQANRYAVYYRLTSAKRPETKARRLREILASLERRERFH